MKHKSYTLNQIHAENIAKKVATLYHESTFKKTLENAKKNVSLMIEDWGCDKSKLIARNGWG